MPKSEVDDFLKDVSDGSKPKDDSFIDDETDPLKEGTPVSKTEGAIKEDGDGKPLPFHKDPKVQRYIEKEISKALGGVKTAPVAQAPKTGDETDDLTDTLTEIIGNDTPQKIAAIKKFRSQLGRLEERGAEKALAQIREQAEAEQAAEADAREELVTAFDNIEEEFDVDLTSNTTVARKERNEFIDFVTRVSPKDADGDVIQYPDLIETYRLFQANKKPIDNKKAKDLASRSMQRSTDASSTPTTGKTWKDVDRIFGKLN